MRSRVTLSVMIAIACFFCLSLYAEEVENTPIERQDTLSILLGPVIEWFEYETKPWLDPNPGRMDVRIDPTLADQKDDKSTTINGFGFNPFPGPQGGPYKPDADIMIASSDSDWKAEFTLQLCEDSGGSGEMIEFRVFIDTNDDFYLEATWLGLEYWDKDGGKISSFETDDDNRPARWWIYDDPNCDSDNGKKYGKGSRSSLGDWNDRISSFRVKVRGQDSWTPFNIYYDSNHKNQCLPFKLYRTGDANNRVLEISCLNSHWNDRISSAYALVNKSSSVTATSYWTLYKDSDYSGATLELDGEDEDENLNDNPGDINDALTSIRLVVE